MPYPVATADDVAFFDEHGWIVVEDAVDPRDLDQLIGYCDEILAKKETMAFDWAWEKGKPRGARVQDPAVEPDPSSCPSSTTRRSGRGPSSSRSALMGRPVEFWYDQFLAKPPEKSAADAVAPGRGLLGPQPRRPRHHVLDAVPRRRRAQRLHALHRRRPPRRRPRAPASPSTCRATCSSASPTRRARRRLPDLRSAASPSTTARRRT